MKKFHVFERDGEINVSLIVVNPEYRGEGIGRRIFKDLNQYADSVQKTITLTPDDSFGTSKSKLITFYKGLGYVLNKGRHKDYEISELMYRLPQIRENNMISKKRWQSLAGILTEQVDMVADMSAPVEPVEPGLEPIETFDRETKLEDERIDVTDEVKDWLAGYCSYLRAVHLWFHAAHHLTKGTGFAGDHASLYDKIYTEVQDEIDGAIEKAIGLTEDEQLGCPIMLAKNACKIMKEAGCSVNASALEIAEAGLRLEKAYIEFLEEMFASLEDMGLLSLGLSDQLSSSASNHETYVYLLQQRVKES